MKSMQDTSAVDAAIVAKEIEIIEERLRLKNQVKAAREFIKELERKKLDLLDQRKQPRLPGVDR